MFRTFFIAGIAVAALAIPSPQSSATSTSSQCGSSTVQCCDTVAPANSDTMRPVLAALKIVPKDENVLAATGCTAADGVGVGGGSTCISAPVCCEDNYFEGLINLGCIGLSIIL